MRIRFYGRLADRVGSEIELSGVGGCSVGDVRRRLAADASVAPGQLERSRALIAGALVPDDRLVDDSDSLEFLPPVSGG